MKKFLLVIVMLCMASGANAATITRTLPFSWTYDVADEAEITGFEICIFSADATEQNAVVAIGNIPKTARFATGPVTYDMAKTQKLFIRAVSVDPSDPTLIEKSGPSNMIRLLIAPGKFRKN